MISPNWSRFSGNCNAEPTKITGCSEGPTDAAGSTKGHIPKGCRMDGTRRRGKVVAEITLAHIRQLAFMFGWPVGEDHVLALLNLGGHAYGMWMRMMQAG